MEHKQIDSNDKEWTLASNGRVAPTIITAHTASDKVDDDGNNANNERRPHHVALHLWQRRHASIGAPKHDTADDHPGDVKHGDDDHQDDRSAHAARAGIRTALVLTEHATHHHERERDDRRVGERTNGTVRDQPLVDRDVDDRNGRVRRSIVHHVRAISAGIAANDQRRKGHGQRKKGEDQDSQHVASESETQRAPYGKSNGVDK